jgi:hypothetical protein
MTHPYDELPFRLRWHAAKTFVSALAIQESWKQLPTDLRVFRTAPARISVAGIDLPGLGSQCLKTFRAVQLAELIGEIAGDLDLDQQLLLAAVVDVAELGPVAGQVVGDCLQALP